MADQPRKLVPCLACGEEYAEGIACDLCSHTDPHTFREWRITIPAMASPRRDKDHHALFFAEKAFAAGYEAGARAMRERAAGAVCRHCKAGVKVTEILPGVFRHQFPTAQLDVFCEASAVALASAYGGRGMRSEAYLSEDQKFRYWLLRVWDDSLPVMANCGANPSTADALKDDPTIRKDMGFAQRNGFGGLLKLNVGAYRATDPRKWHDAADPYGPENTLDNFEKWMTQFGATTFVAAWGRCIGRFAHRGAAIRARFPNIMCFGMMDDGTPRHTLMLPYTTQLERFTAEVDSNV